MHLKIHTVHLSQEEDLVREQVQRLCSLPMWICLLPVSDCGCTVSGDTVCHPVVWYRLCQILQLGLVDFVEGISRQNQTGIQFGPNHCIIVLPSSSV